MSIGVALVLPLELSTSSEGRGDAEHALLLLLRVLAAGLAARRRIGGKSKPQV
jgi:hypothetical protein